MTLELAASSRQSFEADLIGISLEMVDRVAIDPRISVFAGSLDAFIEQMRETFAAEEGVMRATGCPDQQRHVREHRKFLNTALELRDSVERRFDVFDCWGAILYMHYWIQSHVGMTCSEAGSERGVGPPRPCHGIPCFRIH